jgi:ribosomal protein L15E
MVGCKYSPWMPTWWIGFARAGYQTRMNAVLKAYMIHEDKVKKRA